MDRVDDQVELLRRGAVDLVHESELVERLRNGRPLRIKLGADPSAPDLHLGHVVVLTKLRQFQECGHTVIFLIGDFTGRIGDPTGRSETRRPLTEEEVRLNARTYQDQVFLILDEAKTEIRFNSEWMGAMSSSDMVRLCGHYTLARILERDDFATRFREQRPIHVHELLYPLVQGYDSVALQADVELGGTDQRFNLLVGRELQKAYGLAPQVVLTMPLLEGTDGVQKMSKSLGNAIGIGEPPDDVFGKVMSISDSLMFRYYELLTDRDVPALRREVEAGTLHPMEAKKSLGVALTARFHGAAAAEAAKLNFERRFQQRQLPDEMPEFVWRGPSAGGVRLAAVMLESGMASSLSDARRKIQQGGVRVNGERVLDPQCVLSDEPLVVQVGPRKLRRVTFRPRDVP